MEKTDLTLKRMAPERRQAIRVLQNKYSEIMQDNDMLSQHIGQLDSLDLTIISKRFFSDTTSMPAKAKIITEQCPGENRHLVAICENILKHRFDMLGTGLLDYGATINWHKDIVANYAWPKDQEFVKMGADAFDIIIDRNNTAELKAPWDLSNMHWLPSLATAYYLNQDQRYIDRFIADTKHWLKENPPFYGVNWFCPMNIAMRAINLIVGLTALRPKLPLEFVQETLESLLLHGIVTMGYLEIETHAKRNNHYLTNLVGLYFLGQLFKDIELGGEWLTFAKKELELESAYHFYDDGVIFEDSSCYHRLSSEMLLYAAILAKDNNDDFSEDFLIRLRKSLQFTADILQPNNRIPQFGDNDNGRLIQFFGYSTAAVNDHRHLLALGGEFFDDNSLRAAGAGAEPEAIWTLGACQAAKEQPGKCPQFSSYDEAGYYIMRSPQTTMLIRNARINGYCGGGHAHCDQLSLTLNHQGVDILVDPGSYRYSSDFDARNAFRSVEYHNTIQINDSPMHFYDSETFAGLWWMRDFANAKTLQATFENNQFNFIGEISSYQKSDGCLVSRQITCDSTISAIRITDHVSTSADTPKESLAYSRYLFGPELQFLPIDSSGGHLIKNGKVIAKLFITPGASFKLKKLWFSPRYGERIPTLQLEISWSPLEQATLISTITLNQASLR